MCDKSLRQMIREIIEDENDRERWNSDITCSGALWDEIKTLPSGDPLIMVNVIGFLENFCNGGNSCGRCKLYNKVEVVMKSKKNVCVDSVFELVPFGYYMDSMIRDAKTHITNDRNRNHVLFKLLHRVNKEYNKLEGIVWSDQHIDRMLLFIEKPHLSTEVALNTMYSYWMDVHDAFHDGLYEEFHSNSPDECVESLLFCVAEANETLQRLRRTAKKLDISSEEVLGECGFLGDDDNYEQTFGIIMKETERTQLADFSVTQIEIHDDCRCQGDTVWTDDMIEILRRLLGTFGSEAVDG